MSDSTSHRTWQQYYPEWTSAELDYAGADERTLADVFDHAVRTWPDRPAMTFFGTTLTYAEYGRQVRKTASMLHNRGVRRGDRVAIALPNCPQALVSFYAVLSLGATATLHNPLYTARELAVAFKDHRAKVGIFWDKAVEVARELRTVAPLEQIIPVTVTRAMPFYLRAALKLPVKPVKAMRDKLQGNTDGLTEWSDLVKDASESEGRALIETADVAPADPAIVLYTSGTTGTPKGAALSHANLCANIIQGVAWVPGLGQGEQPERMLAALPIFHAYGLTMNITLGPLIGGTVLLLPAPEKPLLASAMKKQKPTWVPGVPALYQTIMDIAEQQKIDISGVKASFSGASGLPVELVKRWENMTGGLLVEGYGLTETSPIVIGNPMSTDRRPGYVGIPFPDTDVRVVDQDDPSRELPDGEAGELVVKGPQVFGGYLNRPDANEKAFADGWFRTGDMAVKETDGFVKIVSRIKEMIVTGGFNVYPAEVEEVLTEHPSVAQASVVGLPRDDGSETVAAGIVLADGARLDEDVVKDHCRDGLARYKVPRVFQVFEELPADQLGKVRRVEVREQMMG
ncbi:Long-chain-fatty-acid-CoA ligase [Corynebacterium glyciniphilum AJ 3170]|uniref:Long-chain-fatty-acid-CoA ligase n=1 Tax=Corynebacterium glyciniphilum AJ 3170 TaxID=1404245 RepID=X5DVW0_9CORY|nr:long-chain-fatty-acid--CoA ligase [Corynebacterium glyciniphilum]AHW65469.1 Long-chain-fatty-acid-CoA ligase [Corynebacterium glyciniphilum AJ 3170]